MPRLGCSQCVEVIGNAAAKGNDAGNGDGCGDEFDSFDDHGGDAELTSERAPASGEDLFEDIGHDFDGKNLENGEPDDLFWFFWSAWVFYMQNALRPLIVPGTHRTLPLSCDGWPRLEP